MILGFKKQFPWGGETNFVEQILNGTKIHSLRESDMFAPGTIIHMATGVRTKNYQQFNVGIKSLEKVIDIQEVFMTYNKSLDKLEVTIDDKYFYWNDIEKLIKNDGLNRQNFIKWFFDANESYCTWSGYIIHWTDFKY